MPLPAAGPQIVLVVSGAVELSGLELPRGASAWVPAGRPAVATGAGVLVRATTNL